MLASRCGQVLPLKRYLSRTCRYGGRSGRTRSAHLPPPQTPQCACPAPPPRRARPRCQPAAQFTPPPAARRTVQTQKASSGPITGRGISSLTLPTGPPPAVKLGANCCKATHDRARGRTTAGRLPRPPSNIGVSGAERGGRWCVCLPPSACVPRRRLGAAAACRGGPAPVPPGRHHPGVHLGGGPSRRPCCDSLLFSSCGGAGRRGPRPAGRAAPRAPGPARRPGPPPPVLPARPRAPAGLVGRG